MATAHQSFACRGYARHAGIGRLNLVLAQCADLYNEELEVWRDTYEATGKSPSAYSRQKALTRRRKSDPVWEQLSVQIARGVLQRADRAKRAFYRRCKAGESPGYPRFKPRHRYRTLETAEATPAMVNARKRGYAVCIKGLPTIRIHPSRELPPSDQLASVRLTFRGRRLQVSLTYAVEKAPLPLSDRMVGLDMGVTQRITDSTGHVTERRDVDADRAEIERKARRLSACHKGSRRWRQRRRILANAHDRIETRRRNEDHRITTELIRTNGLIAVEALNVKAMTTRGGMRKRGLNRAISEQSWGRVHQQLTYKAAWAGRRLIPVNPQYTSQRCSDCGVVVKKPLAQRWHSCACGAEYDRDHNAARNILALALAGGPLPAADLESAEICSTPLASVSRPSQRPC